MRGEEKIMAALARFVSRRCKLVLLAGLALFALSILAAGRIKVETEIKDLLPADDPQVMM